MTTGSICLELISKELSCLQSLGLTQNQAKVYLCLVKSENFATVKGLSTFSGLAACDVYRVVQQLLKLGLLEEVVGTPKQFRATPPEDAVRILQQKIVEEVEEKNNQAKEFLAEIRFKESYGLPEGSKMALIPHGARAIQFGLPKLKSTRKQMDAIQTNSVFRRFINFTSDELQLLLKNNVSLRFVIEDMKGLENPSEDLIGLLKKRNFKVRLAKTNIQACVLTHDETDAFIGTSMNTSNTPSYWSNNPCVISVVKTYFEAIWRDSLEIPSETR